MEGTVPESGVESSSNPTGQKTESGNTTNYLLVRPKKEKRDPSIPLTEEEAARILIRIFRGRMFRVTVEKLGSFPTIFLKEYLTNFFKFKVLLNKKRRAVILEILSTEKTYLGQLEELVKIEDLLASKNVVSHETLNKIFSDSKPIAVFHRELYDALDKRINVKNWSWRIKVGDIFTRMVKRFVKYVDLLTIFFGSAG